MKYCCVRVRFSVTVLLAVLSKPAMNEVYLIIISYFILVTFLTLEVSNSNLYNERVKVYVNKAIIESFSVYIYLSYHDFSFTYSPHTTQAILQEQSSCNYDSKIFFLCLFSWIFISVPSREQRYLRFPFLLLFTIAQNRSQIKFSIFMFISATDACGNICLENW